MTEEDRAEGLAAAGNIEGARVQALMEGARVQTLMGVAASLPAEERAQVIGEALEAARRIKDDPIWLVTVLTQIIPFLVGDQRREILSEAMSAAQRAAEDDTHPAPGMAFERLIPYLAGEQLAQAKAALRNIKDTAAVRQLVIEGEIFSRDGRYQDAVAAFDKVIRRLSRPDDASQVRLLGRALIGRADNLEKLGEGEKALSGLATAIETLAQVQRRLGRGPARRGLAGSEALGVHIDESSKELQRSPGQIDVHETARIDEGLLSDEQKIISAEENLRAFLRARGVPDERMEEAVQGAELLVIKMRVRMVPKWDDRPNEVRYLTAPGYLRGMYPFLFDQSGRLEHEELVREHDPKLIRLIQQYISQRTLRHAAGLGDAEGLIFRRKDARGRPAKPREPAGRRRKGSAPSVRPR